MNLLTARWVVPVASPPIENGAILVDGGKIAAVGRRRDLADAAEFLNVDDLGDVALLPGLVNAHAHLELTDIGKIEGKPDFTGWLKEIIRLKINATGADFARSARVGAKLCREAGQAVVADVVSVRDSVLAHLEWGPQITLQAEVICPSDGIAPEAVERGASLAESGGGGAGCLFPHAPYTVGEAGYRLAAGLSVERYGRYFTHLAESPEEVEFCLTGRGPIAEILYAGLPVSPPVHPGVHPLDWLDSMGLVGPFSVFVHAVHLEGRHMDLLARKGAFVVLCPRSNRNLGVGRASGIEMLKANIPVALGTDGILSAGGLDLWDEVTLAVEEYGFSPMEAIRAATATGAAALGLHGERGALKPGAIADILAVRLGDGQRLDEGLMNSVERSPLRFRAGVNESQ